MAKLHSGTLYYGPKTLQIKDPWFRHTSKVNFDNATGSSSVYIPPIVTLTKLVS